MSRECRDVRAQHDAARADAAEELRSHMQDPSLSSTAASPAERINLPRVLKRRIFIAKLGRRFIPGAGMSSKHWEVSHTFRGVYRGGDVQLVPPARGDDGAGGVSTV